MTPPADIHLCAVPLHICRGWSVSPIEYIRSDGMSLLRWSYKRHWDTHVGVSLSLHPSLSLSLPLCPPILSPPPLILSCHLLCGKPAHTGNQRRQQPHETQSQNHPAQPLLDAWPSETVWDKKGLGFALLYSGVMCYAGVDNQYTPPLKLFAVFSS